MLALLNFIYIQRSE